MVSSSFPTSHCLSTPVQDSTLPRCAKQGPLACAGRGDRTDLTEAVMHLALKSGPAAMGWADVRVSCAGGATYWAGGGTWTVAAGKIC